MTNKFSGANVSDFAPVKQLYASNSGGVYLGRYKGDSLYYILKERKISELGNRKETMHEVNLLLQVDSPFIVKCQGWFGGGEEASLYIVLEYCDSGDLTNIIQNCRSKGSYLDERYVWFLFLQICCGVRSLHERGIVHRDLKPSNILCCKRGARVKVGDLGVSRQVDRDTLMLNTFFGTPLVSRPSPLIAPSPLLCYWHFRLAHLCLFQD
jgi:serine/threonine protein kinase